MLTVGLIFRVNHKLLKKLWIYVSKYDVGQIEIFHNSFLFQQLHKLCSLLDLELQLVC